MLSDPLLPFTPDHLDQAVVLSQAEKWPHRREDWGMLLGLSTGRVAPRDDMVIGTAMRTDYGPDVSMMNMIIVKQSGRGRGLGRALMQSLMDEVSGRELRLVATKDGLPLYEKLGFVSESVLTQCQGQIMETRAPTRPVVPACGADLDGIIALDQDYLAADRSRLLRWLAQNAEIAVTRAPSGAIIGYAVLRQFGRGHVVGPIIAGNAEHAKDLLCHFAHRLVGDFVRVDTDEALGLVPWLESIGLKRVGGGIMMRKNSATAQRPVFGCCSQALG